MEKMWAGRTSGDTNKLADDFNSSIKIDGRMYKCDIEGSVAHAAMLAHCGIIGEDEAAKIITGLQSILSDIESGNLVPDPECEDIHMFVEKTLTDRIGEAGKKLHTARSRNDQTVLDLRMFLREKTDGLLSGIKKLAAALTDKAEEYKAAIMPGYTHMQRAQPITFGHQLLAYVMMLMRDAERLSDCRKRINVSPIGCCALAGTTFDTDRTLEAELLGFDGVCKNSIDGVSDRDFCIELAGCLSIVMMHLSRLCEELVLWSGAEFGYIELDDGFTTGSSIMPQKKNPDPAELIRGKTGRVYGDLIALLTIMKGLPLAYNKDMQEDKEQVFDACDTVGICLEVAAGMIETMKVNTANMKAAAQKGFINATDLADYLVGKGIPFRTAYKAAGETVAYCIKNGFVLETLPLDKYKELCGDVGRDVYSAVDLENCVSKRISYGGTSVSSVKKQIEYVRTTFLK